MFLAMHNAWGRVLGHSVHLSGRKIGCKKPMSNYDCKHELWSNVVSVRNLDEFQGSVCVEFLQDFTGK